jgi:hypothetical protein
VACPAMTNQGMCLASGGVGGEDLSAAVGGMAWPLIVVPRRWANQENASKVEGNELEGYVSGGLVPSQRPLIWGVRRR